MIDAAMAEFGRLNAEVERLTQERETAGMAAHDAGAEIDRLQRRVVELEAIALNLGLSLQAAEKEASDNREEWHAADDEAAEQRKRAEEERARADAAEMNAIEGQEVGADVCAAAIEEARQEALDRAVEAVGEVASKWLGRGAAAFEDVKIAIRALKSTKEPT